MVDFKLATFPILVQLLKSHHIILQLSTTAFFWGFQWERKRVFNFVHVMIKIKFRKSVLVLLLFFFSEMTKQCCFTSCDMDFMTYKSDQTPLYCNIVLIVLTS